MEIRGILVRSASAARQKEPASFAALILLFVNFTHSQTSELQAKLAGGDAAY